jgi:hypothetical protein
MLVKRKNSAKRRRILLNSLRNRKHLTGASTGVQGAKFVAFKSPEEMAKGEWCGDGKSR